MLQISFLSCVLWEIACYTNFYSVTLAELMFNAPLSNIFLAFLSMLSHMQMKLKFCFFFTYDLMCGTAFMGQTGLPSPGHALCQLAVFSVLYWFIFLNLSYMKKEFSANSLMFCALLSIVGGGLWNWHGYARSALWVWDVIELVSLAPILIWVCYTHSLSNKTVWAFLMSCWNIYFNLNFFLTTHHLELSTSFVPCDDTLKYAKVTPILSLSWLSLAWAKRRKSGWGSLTGICFSFSIFWFFSCLWLWACSLYFLPSQVFYFHLLGFSLFISWQLGYKHVFYLCLLGSAVQSLVAHFSWKDVTSYTWNTGFVFHGPLQTF